MARGCLDNLEFRHVYKKAKIRRITGSLNRCQIADELWNPRAGGHKGKGGD